MVQISKEFSALMRRDLTLEDVRTEMFRQDGKWGAQRSHTLDHWNTILSEETGELAEAILEDNLDAVRKEAVQVAAVAAQIIEALDAAVEGERDEHERRHGLPVDYGV